MSSDVIGCCLAFNVILFLAGIFRLAVGGGPNQISICALFAGLGLRVGGNLPADGSLFLKFLPFQSENLLTLLSVFCPVSQPVSSVSTHFVNPNIMY
jgi:hypothetical protein